MKIFSQASQASMGGKTHDKGKLASKRKYFLKPSVKSKPPASQQLAGHAATTSGVTALEQARGLS